ncbi:epimerase [Spartobacteria bacterium LR76]|nr:epimerase [Spartobacteria bacterium LR76]
MKILLIGGAGFIGSHTALRLLREGHEPVVLDSLDPQIHGTDLGTSATFGLLNGRVPVICGDTRDRGAVERAVRDVEAIYYFPAGTGTGQSMYQIERYTDINARGAAVFGEVLGEHKAHIRKVIVSSTRAIYGEGAAICPEHGRVYPDSRKLADLEAGIFETKCPICGAPMEPSASLESDPARPSSIYGITKLAQEQIVSNVCQSHGIPAVVFRYQNVYGPGQSLNNAYTGILSIFTQLLLAGREINLFEDSLPSRDFVFIDDLVEYNVRALSLESDGLEVFNLGSGVRSTLVDLVEALAAALGVELKYFISGQFRVGDIRHAAADLTRLTAGLGAHEFLSLCDGVKQFTDWVGRPGEQITEANRRFDHSLNEMAAAGLLRSSRK